MEAIAAFALACNVVQVVDFGLKTASKCAEIYKDGSSIEHQDLNYTSKHLAEITGNLNASILHPRTNKPLTQDEHELAELAARCTKTANDLRDELDKLTLSGRQGKRAAVFKAIKSIRRNDCIKKIKDRLGEYESVLNTRLLSRLSDRVDLLALQQDDSFGNLDQSLQAFIKNVAKGFNKVEDLISQENTTTRSTINQEHRITRDHVTSKFQDMKTKNDNDQNQLKLLASLNYDEIHQRQEEISEAHERTFKWIFDRTGKDIRPWDCFINWLEKGDGVYWICGKAGSGKSTLMNYIATNPRTLDSLNVWGRQSRVLTLTFFGWNAGTGLQKSSLGLLRSLLHQLLSIHQDLISELVKLLGIAAHDDQTPIWTRKRLESSLKFAINKTSIPICLFIDGLDEFDEDEEDLILLIQALRSRPSLKICLSSRPIQTFINAFRGSAQLKLQDLTRPDIEIYVADRLQNDPRMEQLLRENSQRGKHLISDVIDKAEGVFLWVTLAVKLLLKGLSNKDDWDTMAKRLDLLPKGIENLYTHMWNRLGEDQKIYHEEAALYFRLILQEEVSLLQFVIATNESLQSRLLDFELALPKIDDVISLCTNAEIRILTRCGGLLEVDHLNEGIPDSDISDTDISDTDISDADISDADISDADISDADISDADISNEDTPNHDMPNQDIPDESMLDDDAILERFHQLTNVRFLHRTARDFLVDTKEGQLILGQRPPPPSSVSVILVKCGLGIKRLLPESPQRKNLRDELESVRQAQILENDPLESLMDVVDSYFSSIYSGVPRNMHWLENFKMKWFATSPAANFTGFAASCGLCLDMSKRFIEQLKRTDRTFINNLLTCAFYCPRSLRRIELMLMLLSNGADPSTTCRFNQILPQVSCWNEFLHWVWVSSFEFDKWPSSDMKLCKLIDAFMSNGADPHEEVKFGVGLYEKGAFFMNYDPASSAVLTLQLNARYILSEILRDHPQLPDIEKRFERAGAQANRRVLLVYDRARGLSKKTSERDSQYLLEAIDECLIQPRGQKDAARLRTRIEEVRRRDACTSPTCEPLQIIS